jgi:hypothetical protein
MLPAGSQALPSPSGPVGVVLEFGIELGVGVERLNPDLEL